MHDLPVLAVDSFQHMFLLPGDIETCLTNPDILKRYISDLHSGKLHREFHNGPDTVVQTHQTIESKVDNQGIPNQETTPIPSVFRKLRPNSNRYTLFHDEF